MSRSLIVVEHRAHASSKEQVERLLGIKLDAVSRQTLREAAAAQHFAIDQHAVAIEDDEIGLGHRRLPYPNSPARSEHMLTLRATARPRRGFQYGGALWARCAFAASVHHDRSSAKRGNARSSSFPTSPIGLPSASRVLAIRPTVSLLAITTIPISH